MDVTLENALTIFKQIKEFQYKLQARKLNKKIHIIGFRNQFKPPDHDSNLFCARQSTAYCSG